MPIVWTQDEIDAVRAAIARGTVEVQFADRRVTYQSLDQLLKLLDRMLGDVAAADTATPSYRLAATNKGLGGPYATRWRHDWPS